jgi:hypothetical protein
MQAMHEIRFSESDWQAGFKGREEMMTLVLLALPALAAPAERGATRASALLADPVYQLK